MHEYDPETQAVVSLEFRDTLAKHGRDGALRVAFDTIAIGCGPNGMLRVEAWYQGKRQYTQISEHVSVDDLAKGDEFRLGSLSGTYVFRVRE